MGKVIIAVLVIVIAVGVWYFVTQSGTGSGTPGVDIDPYVTAAAAFTALQYDKALELYQKAVAAKPDHADATLAHYRMGKCLEELKRNPEAIKEYEAYLKAAPQGEHSNSARQRVEFLKNS